MYTVYCRKKILDFYHRTSIGSYCTAFSYCPVQPKDLSHLPDVYVELPDDQHCGHLADRTASVLVHAYRREFNFGASEKKQTLIPLFNAQSNVNNRKEIFLYRIS